MEENKKELVILSDVEDAKKQPLSPDKYSGVLTVLERKISEAEGIGEVLYFEEHPTVPHLAKYFEIYVNPETTAESKSENAENSYF